jgi:hypothetical protein
MFERYTEEARRVIFFARYEASQYGSPYIETEHLLLGLCREDRTIKRLLRSAMDSDIRKEIERRIVRGQRYATSVEVPLSMQAKKVLHFAAEEADRLSQRHIGTEHMLLGLLRIEDSLGAEIARGRGLKAEQYREKLAADPPQPVSFQAGKMRSAARRPSLPVLEEFLNGLKWKSSGDLIAFFAEHAQIVDVHGRRWNYDEIAANSDQLFVPYAKKNATYVIEETPVDSDAHLVAVVLWKNALVASMERVWMHRMTVVMVPKGGEWAIVSIQVTPVQP